MSTSEKFCLKWNDFQDNISSAFGSLRDDADLTDVTLVCEDGQQVEAHKVILAASSPFFLNMLRRNKHSHPLIYMRGIKSEQLVALVDFLYHGEANILQENLDIFLAIAEELKLKGLTGDRDTSEIYETTMDEKPKVKEFLQTSQISKQKKIHNEEPVLRYIDAKCEEESVLETSLVLQSDMFSGGLKELDEKIKLMYIKTKRDAQHIWICKICGKETSSNGNMRNHIEANHIEGISLPCNFCEKIFR